MDFMVQLRNKADYELTSNEFDNDKKARRAVNHAAADIPILDAIESDPIRRAAVIADIRARWP